MLYLTVKHLKHCPLQCDNIYFFYMVKGKKKKEKKERKNELLLCPVLATFFVGLLYLLFEIF